MTEEHIVRTEDSSGDTHTTRTVITDEPRRSGSNWALILLVVVIALVGVWFMTQMTGTEAAKDNAVAEAAGEVGKAANKVGDAAQSAGEAVEDAVAK